jgi:hypothetical protein
MFGPRGKNCLFGSGGKADDSDGLQDIVSDSALLKSFNFSILVQLWRITNQTLRSPTMSIR